MKYKHLFFDLDNTLWDFDYNSKIVLGYIYDKFFLKSKGVSSKNQFIKNYKKVNGELWLKYREGMLTKNVLRYQRFLKTLSSFNIDDKYLSKEIGNYYVANSPYQTKLMDGANEVLFNLSLHYNLHIITNGFKEVQAIKLKKSGIFSFFDKIIVSEDVGVLKPNKKIFQFALDKCGAKIEECLMIGDDLISDIYGAREFGMDQVFFNYKFLNTKVQATYKISSLKEIEDILL
tara:strand:- start:47 stop:742 length:696 start_codon:yes stop_codon:yes gene_type:complete